MAEDRPEAGKGVSIVAVIAITITVAVVLAVALANTTPQAPQGEMTSDATISNTTIPNVPPASYSDMVSSCQSVADNNLRNGFYEQDYTSQTDTQPRQVADSVYFNATKSTCYFTERLIRYPAVYSNSDPYMEEGDYLYAAALLPSGIVQDAPKGDSEVSGVFPMAYCTIDTYNYPTQGSTNIHCVDFELQQIGAGTNNYHANALAIGATISQAQYNSLVQEYMNQSQ